MLKITHNDVRMTSRRKEAIKALSFYAKKLRIHKFDAEVHLAFKHGFTDLFGILASCEYTATGLVTIDIDSKIPDVVLLSTLAHEMVHARQHLTGSLGSTPDGLMLWKGKTVPAKLTYSNEPWEREAMRKEVILSHQYNESR